MILGPNVIVLYVDDLTIASQFYQDLLGIKPIEASISFHRFTLSNGMGLALKEKASVVPPVEETTCSGELVFTLDDSKQVDEQFVQWKTQNVNMIFPPAQVTFGYTFVALDPDGNRLRVVSLGK